MPKLYLIRHAKPAASWGEDRDPGLDATGEEQARATAAALAKLTSALPILTSPMRRCRETAQPLESTWSSAAALFPAVAEIPSPPLPLNERHKWLADAMAGTWQRMQLTAPSGSPDFLSWRDDMLSAVLRIPEDAVVFSHFIAINAIVGVANGTDDVVSFRPDHASVTIVDTTGGSFRVAERGREAVTSVLTRA
jgi:broad specificity phosphatase PhoE